MARDRDPDGFGSVLRAHRLLAGLTQEALAHDSGVAVRTISDLERGRVRRPQRHTVDLLANALNVPGAESALISAARQAGLDDPLPAMARPPGTRALRARPLPGPDPVPGFVGRADEIAAMDALLMSEGHRLLVLSGPPGVGKTSLARQWSYAAAGRFGDGCLYVDLRGFGGSEPLSAAAALSALLHQLGVVADEIPAESDDAGVLARELTADRRLVVVLDNARDAAQVRPLIMPSASVVTIVTSRQQMPGLVVSHAARTVLLGVLPRADSISLLIRLTGTLPGAAGELDELARVCADLPLALRIAAAQLATIAIGIPALAAQIASSALRSLTVADDQELAVRAAFDSSYQALSGPARELFELLGLPAVADVSTHTAAAMTDRPVAWVRSGLAELVRACLVRETTAGRFSCHDLLRTFAAELIATMDADHERTLTSRLCAYLTSRACAAAQMLYPQMTRLPSQVAGDAAGFPDAVQARDWLDCEAPGMMRVIRHAAADSRAPQAAWELADALRGWFFHQRAPDWIPVTSLALDAARQAGAVQAVAALHASLGLAMQCAARWPEAVTEFNAAIAAARRCEWTECLAAATGNLGSVHYQCGEPERALALYLEALELNRSLGNLGGQAIRFGNIGAIHRLQGHPQAAEQCYQQAQELYERVGSTSGQAMMLINLGTLAVERLDGDRARALGTAALDLAGHARSVPALCLARRLLADAARITGAYATALALAEHALADSEGAADPRLAVDCLVTLAKVQLAAGHADRGREHARTAADLAAATGYDEASEAAARLLADGC